MNFLVVTEDKEQALELFEKARKHLKDRNWPLRRVVRLPYPQIDTYTDTCKWVSLKMLECATCGLQVDDLNNLTNRDIRLAQKCIFVMDGPL